LARAVLQFPPHVGQSGVQTRCSPQVNHRGSPVILSSFHEPKIVRMRWGFVSGAFG